MTAQVIAVLDRPSAKSMGMVGLVIADDSGALRTEGVVGSQSGKLSSEELGQLVGSGHAQRIDSLAHLTDKPSAAFWVGRNFADEAGASGLPVPPVPSQNSRETSEGTLWVAPAAHIWHILNFWLLHAFREVVTTRTIQVSRLMTWALPQRAETHAARWLTADGSDAKRKELAWSSRLRGESGESTATIDVLVKEFGLLIAAAEKSKDERVVGFSAPARGGDKEIAEFLAKTKQVTNASFGKWLKQEAPKYGYIEPKRRDLQILGTQIIRERGELALFLEVLESFALRPSQSCVIEGIRHRKVLDSVRSVVGNDLFFFAYADLPLAERKRLLKEKEHLNDQEIEVVLHDPTEIEIPDLKRDADIRLDIRNGVAAEAGRVEQRL